MKASIGSVIVAKVVHSPEWLVDLLGPCSLACMTDYIIDSRGYFWSAELTIPDRCFAPEKSVTGQLRLNPDGTTQLDLDATLDLSGNVPPVHRILSRGDVNGAICGFLLESNKHVRLSALSSDGGAFASGGPIRERLVAFRCLVSQEPFRPGVEPRFRWLDLPLDGYEEWLGPGHISTSGDRRFSATYARQMRPVRWQAGDLAVELHRYLHGNGGKDITQIGWRERSYLRLGGYRADLTFEKAIDLAQRIEDLLVLMADHEQRLEFGTLRHFRSGKPVEFYYARDGRGSADEMKRHKAFARLDACKEQFGDLIASWLAKYEIYGPGFHLYLGNRRGQNMYPEHSFASLMWGLEALHRGMVPSTPNPAQAAKVERILAAIQQRKDRVWAERFLPRQSEPSLADRLLDLFSMLDLGLERSQLASFAQRCAARRNDVSHFGGQREPGGYEAFLDDIVRLNQAVDLLYHALILHVVGVPDSILKYRMVNGPYGHRASAALASCGLEVPPS